MEKDIIWMMFGLFILPLSNAIGRRTKRRADTTDRAIFVNSLQLKKKENDFVKSFSNY